MNWKIISVGCSLVLSGHAYADWFFRGTANNWNATELSAQGNNQYSTCQSFGSGDAGGGPRFKIDRFGDWQESYPGADVQVNSNQSYEINFDAISKNISTTAVADCNSQPGFSQQFAQLYFRGTANNWNADAMALVDDNTWQLDVAFDGQANQRFKLDVEGDWSQNYGDSNSDNILESSGGDIYVQGVATYRITVNDATLAYSVVPITSSNLLPIAVISPGGSISVAVNDNLVLSGSESSDQDGIISQYSWSTGETTESISVDTSTPGSFSVQLTVTDDQGGSDTDTVTINVTEMSGDSWYFRGTPNNWATTAMTTSDGLVFCTQQSFAANNPRFKVDHYGDWTESYPGSDYLVNPNSTYDICFDTSDNSIDATEVVGTDTQPPVATATPSAGSYQDTQSITLAITDNQDSTPQLYYTTDGSTPTSSSALYSGQNITASDVGTGTDLVIKTLAIDADNNQQIQTFSYQIGALPDSGDFRSETIYFVMTARFYDGDTSNNYYNRDRIKAGDPHWRGDFKGLIQQLDYIKDLGFTAIWVTPPVENRSGLDYHGYHAYDFYQVDPRLESPDASYQDFINAAHSKGLKVVQDVVVNHSGQYGLRGEVWIDHLPIKYYVPTGAEQGDVDNGPYQGNLGDYSRLNRDDNDNPVAPQWFRDRHNSDPDGLVPLVDPKTGVTVPSPGYDANRFFGIDAQGLDPNWYHLDGFMAGGDWENPTALQKKHMAGDTIDLATGNQNVKDYLNGAIQMYLDMGVDAIRLDTVKHVERDELLTYIHNWQSHKPGLFVFGENLVKGTGWGSEIANDNASAVIRPWWYTRTTQDPANPNGGGDSGLAVLDFSLFSTFRDNVTRGNLGGVGGIFSMDWIYGDATKLVTFFQNHDVGPDNDFKYRFGGDQAHAALVYNLLWTVRGIPSLYYGEEIMFQAGLPQDIASANDTIDQTGRAYFGPHLDDLSTTQSHPLYQHIKRLNQIRKGIPALQKAPMSQVNEWSAGMSFVRDLSSEGSYAVVGLAASSPQNITVSGIQNGTYTDVVSGTSLSTSNGSLQFSVPAYSARIWVLNGPGKIGSDGLYLK
ncbi:alpha-amylase family glycosyl hydrolase [Planctobacterium marinum]|uniref:alpha-amylase family glycosyl hydrolase n=1 Tax=Planctobacterium marinum TaxID=1631968 RepID=UPI001E3E2894|nr:alpha-amylase family glycosyl hydrolase [Planctobacterium marinum]MCC2608119.1 chitobiase/beta-hexosaminidase C-terminal domain-containing protein [Planctobacterium marinum]